MWSVVHPQATSPDDRATRSPLRYRGSAAVGEPRFGQHQLIDPVGLKPVSAAEAEQGIHTSDHRNRSVPANPVHESESPPAQGHRETTPLKQASVPGGDDAVADPLMDQAKSDREAVRFPDIAGRHRPPEDRQAKRQVHHPDLLPHWPTRKSQAVTMQSLIR